MKDGFIARVISLVLIIIMFIICPYIYSYSMTEWESRRVLLNDVSSFLDKVTDKRSISQDDLNEFSLQVASSGKILNIKVERLVKVYTKRKDGTINITYIVADNNSELNPRDIVRVSLNEITTSTYSKIMSTFLKLNEDNYSLTMSATVR
ncbi:hypothetical protein acsn021_06630 [Anaerocolumna cellulosilytica]|uniref:Uncharacterized protein n=1 Tax=Anaerocolumna cellulosilytica TaxID=433286 RepID=A0A6S6QR57_9FIRM|nr:hypothetical protein [Anaerocolumna cellulosilytica]MBB5197682.1 hypothetical protein [Anaerocolumna cellulosilytica]BCJ93094.1 hypothetical protein acsn021_06630 [Anaerocolumna cellulosilytica]